MFKALLLAAAVLAGTVVPVQAKEAYQMTITRTSDNVYKLDGRNVQIHTQGCAKSAQHTQSIFLTEGETGTLLFDAKTKCAVTKLTRATKAVSGNVTINTTVLDFSKIARDANRAALDVLKALG